MYRAASVISAVCRADEFKISISLLLQWDASQPPGAQDAAVVRLYHDRDIFSRRHCGLQAQHLTTPGADDSDRADDVGFKKGAEPAASCRPTTPMAGV